MYSPENPNSPERKPEKRRSLLQAPKVYSSKLVKPEDSVPKTQPIDIPQTSPSQISVPDTCQVEAQEFFIGDRVRIAGVKTGTLLYFGTTHIAAGLWCGIALDESDGIHDGLVNGVRYFTCRKGHGIFAPVDKVKHVVTKKALSVCQVVSSPSRVPSLSSQSKLCESEVEEYSYHERSGEVVDTEPDLCDLTERLTPDDELCSPEGADDLREKSSASSDLPRRRVPKLPRGSYGVSRLPFKRRDLGDLSRMTESVVDGAMEKLKMIAEVEGDGVVDSQTELNQTFSLSEEKFISPDLQHSAGGSSGGGDDSWSLSSKDYMAGDCKHYLNITFDENTESKTSTQEASEEDESVSPEFIFDQEMIEDGEFSSQPMQMSRDSSLGLLTSFTLDKTDLLYELMDGDEGRNHSLPPEDIQSISVGNISTPNKLEQEDFVQAVSSTPATDQKTQKASLDGTFTMDNNGGVCLNNTYTHVQATSDHAEVQNKLNSTFTKDSDDESGLETQEVLALKSEFPVKSAMVDSGISMKGSMTESGMSVQNCMIDSLSSVQNSVVDSVSAKSTVVESLGRGSMQDSGISMKSSVTDSMDTSVKREIEMKCSESDRDDSCVRIKNEDTNLCSKEMNKQHVLGIDDQKLMTDLKDGHTKRERPVSFISTTSADTGYVPDTDSELGTLTLNSPQDWMDKAGFHGRTDTSETLPPTQRHLLNDLHLGGKIPPPVVESDSDVGTMTGDTDNEVERAEIVMPVQPGEATLLGVDLELEPVSDNENDVMQRGVTDGGSGKVLNVTQTISVLDDDVRGNVDSFQPALDSTFTTETQDTVGQTDKQMPKVVTVVIENKEDISADEKTAIDDLAGKTEENKKNEKSDKTKSPRKKKFNVVKDFKKPNTNVVSKLADYIKTPLPVKPKEDKINTEEAKNKRNTQKSKQEVKTVSKIEEKTVTLEKKKEVLEETVKKVKRTPPKSKWDSIMSQIDSKKDVDKQKGKPEVKSKLESYLHIPPPTQIKKEETKPKRRISNVIPDYSKVQSKLHTITSSVSPAPQQRKAESPKRRNEESPRRGRRLSRDSSKQRGRHVSGDSVKKFEVRDGALRIGLADSLDGRGSRTGTGSGVSSVRSSHTDLSAVGADDESSSAPKILSKRIPLAAVTRSMSLQSERRDSTSAVSEISDTLSQGLQKDTEQSNEVLDKKVQRRKSGICPPSSSPARGPTIVKPVLRQRQHSASPSFPKTSLSKQNSMFARPASMERPPTKRSRNQNRNKTSKTKEKNKSVKPTETTVPADIHSKEIQRLEALCETRTKQLNMVKLQLQSSNQAFDGMSALVSYLAHDLDAFSCPKLMQQIGILQEENSKCVEAIGRLEEEKVCLMKELDQVKSQADQDHTQLKADYEAALTSQQQVLEAQHKEQMQTEQENHSREIKLFTSSHDSKVLSLKADQDLTVKTLKSQQQEEIKQLQSKHENQMEELHKQHQDKLEDITNRFDGIKMTLSEKVETLRSECDQLRNRAKLCEEALQRDSDYKVQLALAPYKNLPQEIESLKTVLEMKNEEIQKLRSQNLDLQKQLEDLPVAQEKIIALQQKKENLEAIISMKTDHEKTLHEKCQNLMKKYDKESRANKRLSMDYEELMWKLSESFSESGEIGEMGSQEALFFQKVGISPKEGLESPDLGRKFRTHSSSDMRGSPSKSPTYRRSTSNSGEDADKRLKRRSGTYLLDDKKRATSPLARQNPLTRSWSPSTASPPPVTSSPVPNKMSQSWNEEVFDSSAGIEGGSAPNTPQHLSRRQMVGSEKSVSVLSSRLQEEKTAALSGTVIRLNGTTADTSNQSTTESVQTTRSGRDTVTLTEEEMVFKHGEVPCVENSGGTETNYTRDTVSVVSPVVHSGDHIPECMSDSSLPNPAVSKIPMKHRSPTSPQRRPTSPDSPGKSQQTTPQVPHSVRESAV